jgi:hypothetical protein
MNKEIEEELTRILSDELSKSINNQIMGEIFDSIYQEELDLFNKVQNRERIICEITGEEFKPSEPPSRSDKSSP